MLKEELERKLIREFLYKNIIKELNENNSSGAIDYNGLYKKISNNINNICVESFFNTIKNLKNELQKKYNKFESNSNLFFKNFYKVNNQKGSIKFIDSEFYTSLNNKKNIFAIPLYNNMEQNFGFVIKNAISYIFNNKGKSINNLPQMDDLFDKFKESTDFKCIICFKIKDENNLAILDGKPELFFVLGKDKKNEITNLLANKILNHYDLKFDISDDAKDIGKKIGSIIDSDKLNKKIDSDNIFESKILLYKGNLLLESLKKKTYIFLKGTLFEFFTGTSSRFTGIIGKWLSRYVSADIIRAANRAWFEASLNFVTKGQNLLKIKSPGVLISDAATDVASFKQQLIKGIDNTLNTFSTQSDKAAIESTFVTALNKLKNKLNNGGTPLQEIVNDLNQLHKNYKKIAYKPHRAHLSGKSSVTRGGEIFDEMKPAKDYVSGAFSQGAGKFINRLGYITDIWDNGTPFTFYYWVSFIIWSNIIPRVFNYFVFNSDDIKSMGGNKTLKSFIDSIIKSDRMYVYSDNSGVLDLNNFSSRNIMLINNKISKSIQIMNINNKESNSTKSNIQNQKNIGSSNQKTYDGKNIGSSNQKTYDRKNIGSSNQKTYDRKNIGSSNQKM